MSSSLFHRSNKKTFQNFWRLCLQCKKISSMPVSGVSFGGVATIKPYDKMTEGTTLIACQYDGGVVVGTDTHTQAITDIVKYHINFYESVRAWKIALP
ncbi:hypothetical protein D918_06511 [Trichuris suis]|nr:hypothetical protein D918_06511 [Trichuris suis]